MSGVKIRKNKFSHYDFPFIDIHSHILPDIDDGAASANETRNMLVIAYSENIRCVYATAHFRSGWNVMNADEYNKKLDLVREIGQSTAPDLQIISGNELYYNDDAVTALKGGYCRTLAQSQYILVEFHPRQDFRELRLGLSRLISAGYWPVLAHIERYNCLRYGFRYIDELLNMRVYMQVNADSVTQNTILGAGAWIRRLMAADQIHFVATDSHNDGSRPPRLIKCANYIAGKFGVEYVKKLLYDNPLKIINNEYI